MNALPGKDTIEAAEKRIGKLPMKILLWVVALAIIFTAGGVVVNGLRSSFTWLQPYIPAQLELNETVFRVATLLVYVLLGAGAWLVWRKFQKFASDAEHAAGRENVALDAIVESENKIEKLGKKVASLEERLGYIEEKVGDELTDTLTKRLIEQGNKLYLQKPEPEAPAPPDPRVELGKKLLREAAQELRYAFNEPLGWDTKETASRGWLALQITRLLKDILSPETLGDFHVLERAIEEKRKVREESADSKAHAMKLVEFMESLADRLTDFDLDEDIDLPPSFENFKKEHGG